MMKMFPHWFSKLDSFLKKLGVWYLKNSRSKIQLFDSVKIATKNSKLATWVSLMKKNQKEHYNNNKQSSFEVKKPNKNQLSYPKFCRSTIIKVFAIWCQWWR